MPIAPRGTSGVMIATKKIPTRTSIAPMVIGSIREMSWFDSMEESAVISFFLHHSKDPKKKLYLYGNRNFYMISLTCYSKDKIMRVIEIIGKVKSVGKSFMVEIQCLHRFP